MNKKSIFIHSLFRTGSTYIWNKLRQNGHYYCYYEPFHPNLSKVTGENIRHMLTSDFDAVKHPQLSQFYWYEYMPLLKEGQAGVPFFKKSFSFDEFCETGENQDLKNYIDYLLEHAQSKTPLLQFNRSALRVSWFKENYPQALNVYLVRNPRDQWQSYFELFKRTGYETFFCMETLIAALNSSSPRFRELVRVYPLIKYHSDNFVKEEHFYKYIQAVYSDEERYLLFYYLWLEALAQNIDNADFVLNVNRLCRPDYSKKAAELLTRRKRTKLEFQDAAITEYSSFQLTPARMEKIENRAWELFVHSKGKEQAHTFLSNLDPEDREYFNLSPQRFDGAGQPFVINKNYKGKIEKSETMLRLLFEELFQLKEVRLPGQQWKLKEKDRILKETVEKKEEILAEKKRIIQRIEEDLNRVREQSAKDWEELRQAREQSTKDWEELRRAREQSAKDREELRRTREQSAEDRRELHQLLEQSAKDREQLQRAEKQTARTREQLQQAEEQLSEINGKLHQGQEQLREKNTELRKSREQFEQQTQEWERVLKSKEEQLRKESREFEKKMEEKDTVLAQKEAQLVQMAIPMQEVREQLAVSEQRLRETEARLQKIRQSISYKIFMAIQKPFKKLARLFRK